MSSSRRLQNRVPLKMIISQSSVSAAKQLTTTESHSAGRDGGSGGRSDVRVGVTVGGGSRGGGSGYGGGGHDSADMADAASRNDDGGDGLQPPPPPPPCRLGD